VATVLASVVAAASSTGREDAAATPPATTAAIWLAIAVATVVAANAAATVCPEGTEQTLPQREEGVLRLEVVGLLVRAAHVEAVGSGAVVISGCLPRMGG